MSHFREYSISGYIQSKTTLADRINAIDLLITDMIALMGDTIAGPGGYIINYEMDDQQIHVKTAYRSIVDIEAGVTALERMKQRYINQFNSRVFTLQDRSTFRR